MTPREQHLATRAAAGLFDFSFMGLYEFSGLSSLQPLQSRNLAALAPGRIAYTLLLNTDGSVLIDATVWRLDETRFWLFTGKRGGYGAHDRSGEHAILCLQGPSSGAVLSRLLGSEIVRELRYFHFVRDRSMLVARLGYSGELGYELLVPAAEEAGLRAKLRDVPACGFEAADSLRIESGYVLFDREIDGRANPRELGLDRLVAPPVAFPLSRKLSGLEILDERAGREGAPAQLTSECFSPLLGKAIGLGFVAPQAQTGDTVSLTDGRGARVVPLPFYDPERRRPRAAPL